MELLRGFLYVLELEEGKYYVGFSKNVEARIAAHKAGKGSAWTKKYPMVKEVYRYADKTPLDEDSEVKALMLQYGIDNVRGGSYVRVKLPESDRQVLEKELQSAAGVCWKCGQKGHYVGRCPGAKDKEKSASARGPKPAKLKGKPAPAGIPAGKPTAAPKLKSKPAPAELPEEKPAVSEPVKPKGKRAPKPPAEQPTSTIQEVETIAKCLIPAAAQCTICGRNSHSTDQCYASRTVDGKYIPVSARQQSDSSEEEEFPCERCGRDGHIQEDCYARKHLNGTVLP